MPQPTVPTDKRIPRAQGSMTAAMAAATTAGASGAAVPRVLRVGVIVGTALTEERIFRQRVPVTAGRTERSALTLHGNGFPEHVELFTVADGGYQLRITEGMDGRVALPDGVHPLAACRARAIAQRDGHSYLFPLPETSRGRITLAGVTFLFQFVPAPPTSTSRPQLPASLRPGLTRSIDWRYNACFSLFLGLAVGALGWVEYGWDPEVSDDTDAIELIARSVRMDPTVRENDPPTEPPRDPPDSTPTDHSAAADRTADHRPPAPAHPRRTSPSDHPLPAQPNAAAMARAQSAADRAVAAAVRGMNATFAPLTGSTGQHRTAADLLASNALMDGTAEDLRNTHGITTQAPGIHRAMASLVPGIPGHHLGMSDLVASRDRPGTGTVASEGPPRTTLVTRLPSAPVTDTCTGDATAVAHTLQGQLGGLRSCYERVSRSDPSLSGRVTLHFTVGTSGRATEVSVEGMTPALDECLGGAVRRLVFPVPACGVAGYEYPVVFEHGQ